MEKKYHYSDEQRQHINLSANAYNILNDDLYTFHFKIKTLSGYINLIIRDFMDDSDASISKAVQRKYDYYYNAVLNQKLLLNKENNLSKDELKTIELLVMTYKSELLLHFKNKYSKDKVLKIRLQNDIYELFYPTMPEIDYYNFPGEYIKSILEDFADRPHIERESIVYRNIIEQLVNEIQTPNNEQHSILKIEYIPAYKKKAEKYKVKPYKLATDPESRFYYLIGMSCPYVSNGPYNIAVFRLARIIKLSKCSSYGSGKITKAEEKEIEDAIRRKGIQFVFASDEDYIVELTPTGLTMFNNITHMRPVPDANLTKNDATSNTIMHFHSTEMQIYNYFFKFGSNAKILSPPSLAEKFLSNYKNAVNHYLK